MENNEIAKQQIQTRNKTRKRKGKWISIASKKRTTKEQTLLVQERGKRKPETKKATNSRQKVPIQMPKIEQKQELIRPSN